MIEPYYSDDHATIYHGDCLDILDGLTSQPFEHAQAFIMDPRMPPAPVRRWARHRVVRCYAVSGSLTARSTWTR